MVRPDVIIITSDLVGLNEIDLPQFEGYEIMVSRRPIGELKPDVEFANKPTGGFRLLQVNDKFILGDVFTVSPLPKPVAPPYSIPYYPTTQYPHVLTCTIVQASTQDGNGNWQPGAATNLQQACRAEPNNRNAMVKADNGTAIVFDFTVYIPMPVNTIAVGTQVEVYNGDERLSKNTVKRFSRGQLNARLWL